MVINRLVILLMLFFMTSCTKKSELTSRGSSLFVQVNNTEISNFRELTWKVGAYGKQEVSKGIQITIDMPLVSLNDLETIYNKKNADSWLVKIIRKSSMRRELIGYFSVELVSFRNGKPNTRNVAKTGVGVNYSASSISMRLSRTNCPAFGHNLKMEDIKIEGSYRPQMISLTGGDIERIRAKVPEVSYSPLSLNGGDQLKGTYVAEVAFYNQESKTRVSSFIQVGKELQISQEKEVFVKGCQGKTPTKSKLDGNDPIKKFKFSR
ncbi:hypothetical protein OAT67_05220 [Bacteriovoracaceae bacterium]|nr:hypothetical protein [Bacteriovoracaceae bacterium]